jgi:Transposase
LIGLIGEDRLLMAQQGGSQDREVLVGLQAAEGLFGLQHSGCRTIIGRRHAGCAAGGPSPTARNSSVRPYSKGQKNDFRDAEAIAEAVQRPTMKFVATKTADQLDLQALHRVRERLVSQRTGIVNQIRAFLLERGIAVRQGLRFLRIELPRILTMPSDVLSHALRPLRLRIRRVQ